MIPDLMSDLIFVFLMPDFIVLCAELETNRCESEWKAQMHHPEQAYIQNSILNQLTVQTFMPSLYLDAIKRIQQTEIWNGKAKQGISVIYVKKGAARKGHRASPPGFLAKKNLPLQSLNRKGALLL